MTSSIIARFRVCIDAQLSKTGALQYVANVRCVYRAFPGQSFDLSSKPLAGPTHYEPMLTVVVEPPCSWAFGIDGSLNWHRTRCIGSPTASAAICVMAI